MNKYLFVLLSVLLSSCSLMSIGSLKRFNCMKTFSKTEVVSINYEYDEPNKKMIALSGSRKVGGKEYIVGEKYDTYEKEGQLLWKRRISDEYTWDKSESDFFLDLKTMKLNAFYSRDGYEDKQTYDCKKIK